MVISGMVLLVALCGWVVGGEEGARWALSGGTGGAGGRAPVISPEAMMNRFGARLIHPEEWPALFDALAGICRRAGLTRQPSLYVLPDRRMNAYALGGPDDSAITLTDGLLRGMSIGEISGILAHEIGHIRNDDGWAMDLAAALNRAANMTALVGLCQQHDRPLATLLSSAPALGRLLHMTLSRIREFDADAVALELVEDPRALVAALHKLEHHHSGGWRPPVDDVMRFLRSHPETWERVGTLLRIGT